MSPAWDPYADMVDGETERWADRWLTADDRKGGVR
jgi:hypothetical protein